MPETLRTTDQTIFAIERVDLALEQNKLAALKADLQTIRAEFPELVTDAQRLWSGLCADSVTNLGMPDVSGRTSTSSLLTRLTTEHGAVLNEDKSLVSVSRLSNAGVYEELGKKYSFSGYEQGDKEVEASLKTEALFGHTFATVRDISLIE